MKNKQKGANAERELLHKFCNAGFAAVRVAGSGSMTEPACDLVVGNGKKKYAIECKTSRKTRKYLSKSQIEEFSNFAENFGLKPLIAIKFARNGWHFIHPNQLENTGKWLAISFDTVQKNGKTFEQVV